MLSNNNKKRQKQKNRDPVGLPCSWAQLLEDAQRLPEHAGSGGLTSFPNRSVPLIRTRPPRGYFLEERWPCACLCACCVCAAPPVFVLVSEVRCGVLSNTTSEWGSCTHEVSAVRRKRHLRWYFMCFELNLAWLCVIYTPASKGCDLVLVQAFFQITTWQHSVWIYRIQYKSVAVRMRQF